MKYKFGPSFPKATYISHSYTEQVVDLGEVKMNYTVAGPVDACALLLVPGQAESWWGYQKVMNRFENRFRVYAVDLRGQGRSDRTPGRYTFDNMGNDLVRFVERVISQPTVVCGFSSGGILSAWLSAYAPPGVVRAALLEDPPLFSAEVATSCGHSIGESVVSLLFGALSKFLGDQWSEGDWEGFVKATKTTLPGVLTIRPYHNVPPQSLKEYDPEWARAFVEGTVSASCDHRQMLARVTTPILLTHHRRMRDPETGLFVGAISNEQATRVGELVTSARQRFDYISLPEMGHSMHTLDPDLYASLVAEWVATLP